MISALFRLAKDERRAIDLVSLLHPDHGRHGIKVPVTEKVAGKTPVRTPSCRVFRDTMIIAEQTGVESVLCMIRMPAENEDGFGRGRADQGMGYVPVDLRRFYCLQ
jgi:hypothetical protein